MGERAPVARFPDGRWAAASAPTCGTAVPASGAAGWDASTTAYQATWQYSAAGKITQLSQSLAAGAAVTSTYGYADADHPAAVTSATTASGTNEFEYDDAGRMVSRTIDGVTTDLTWDVTSSLTETTVDGAHTVYAYDVSGQRVLQATLAFGTHPGTATAYTSAGQVEDADTSATTVGDVTGTRYYTFGGATVAVRTHDGNLALVLGDEQGSVSVTMPVTLNPDGTMASATVADGQAVTVTSYTPYGQLRGADNLALDRGWLGQVEDRADATTGTGLTYLNARYYDPVLARFITPDPLMNPADPATLDPYRYADNNPVVFMDPSGLAPCSGLSAANEKKCLTAFYKGGAAKATPGKHTVPKKSTPTSPFLIKPKTDGGGSTGGGAVSQGMSPAQGIFYGSGQAFLGEATSTPLVGPWQLPEPGVMNPAPGPYAPGNTNVPRPWHLDVLHNKWLLNSAKAAPYLDVVVAALEFDYNYNERYAFVADDMERLSLSVERTTVTTTVAIAAAAVAVAALSAVACPFTFGVTCAVGSAIVVGIVAYGAEQAAGALYDSANAARVANLRRRDGGVQVW